MFELLKDFLFPKKCVQCGRSGRFLCTNCIRKQVAYEKQRCIKCQRSSLDGLTHPRCKQIWSAEGLYVIFKYRNGIKKIIKDMKFRRLSDLDKELEGLFAGLDRRMVDYWKRNNFVVTWVPMHISKQNERGFNQAESIGKVFARINSLTVIDMLVRSKNTTPQFMQSRIERQKNIRNSIRVKSRLKKENIILIDDVVTTGATVAECVKVLKRGGAGRVWVLSLAG